MTQQEIIKKWTVATFHHKDTIKELLKDKEEGHKLSLSRVIGIVGKASVGSTDKGEYVKFLGDFQCQNLVTGEVVRTTAVILPDVISNGLYAAFESSEGSVQFAYDVIVTKKSSAAVGYTYSAAPLLKPSAADPLSLLIGQIDTPLLSGPSEDAEEATPKKKRA